MTPDMWHLTPDTGLVVNIGYKFQVPSSNGLGVIMFWRYGGKGWLGYSIADGGACGGGSNSTLLIIFMVFRCLICSLVYRTDIWRLKYFFLIDWHRLKSSVWLQLLQRKNLNSFQCNVTENKTTNFKMITFFTNYHFWWVFLIISASEPFKELRFFALLSVYPDASFELSKTNVRWFPFLGYNVFFSPPILQTPGSRGIFFFFNYW